MFGDQPYFLFRFVFIEFSVLFAALSLLLICFQISKDHRKRKRFWIATQSLEKAELYTQFHRCIHLIALFYSSPRRERPNSNTAENALVLATVLLEHIEHQSGRNQFPGYLSVRRRLIAVAKAYQAQPE